MGVPYIPNNAIIFASDLIAGSGGGSPPTSGQYVQYVKFDLGSGSLSSPVAAYLPVSPFKGNLVNYNFTASGAGQLLGANINRKEATFVNNGPSTIWLGVSGITSTTGFPLLATAPLTDLNSNSAWFFYVLSGTNTDMRYYEIS